MSQYGYLACHRCRRVLWLGKAIYRDDEQVGRFRIGDPDDPPNSQKTTLTHALWKMLADHVRHPLQVILDGDAEYPGLGEYTEIGGDEISDIPFEVYLKDWDG